MGPVLSRNLDLEMSSGGCFSLAYFRVMRRACSLHQLPAGGEGAVHGVHCAVTLSTLISKALGLTFVGKKRH